MTESELAERPRLHILKTPGGWSDWTATKERWPDLNGRVLVRCCNRIVPAEETETRRFTPHCETGTDENGNVWFGSGCYFDPEDEWRCALGHGCTVRPGYKRTAHLREGWYDDD